MHIVLKKVGAYENFMNKTNICQHIFLQVNRWSMQRGLNVKGKLM